MLFPYYNLSMEIAISMKVFINSYEDCHTISNGNNIEKHSSALG